MWKNKDIICIPEVKNELEHWTGPTMVDSLLYVMLVCVSVFVCFQNYVQLYRVRAILLLLPLRLSCYMVF